MLDFEVVDARPCELGTIILRKRDLPSGVVFELTLDHQFLMSSETADSERALAIRAIEMHGGTNLEVMVGGLGLGCTAMAALAPNVSRVEVVELLAPVIEWAKRGMTCHLDARITVLQDDVYARLRRPPSRTYDVIVLDVDHSPERRLGNTSDDFYSASSLALVRAHLSEGGVFGVWSYAESPAFEREMRAAFSEVRVDAVSFTNAVVGGEETNWLYFARG